MQFLRVLNALQKINMRCTLRCYSEFQATSDNLKIANSVDNNVVTRLFNHQYCYNLLTRLSNNDNNNAQCCSINIVSPVSTSVNNRCWFINTKQHCSTNNIIRWTILLSHDNRVVTARLFNQLFLGVYTFCDWSISL